MALGSSLHPIVFAAVLQQFCLDIFVSLALSLRDTFSSLIVHITRVPYTLAMFP
jgi:hypothetical protein